MKLSNWKLLILFCALAFIVPACIWSTSEEKSISADSLVVMGLDTTFFEYDSIESVWKVKENGSTISFYDHSATVIDSGEWIRNDINYMPTIDSATITNSTIVWNAGTIYWSAFPNEGDIIADTLHFDSAKFVIAYIGKQSFETYEYVPDDSINHFQRKLSSWIDVVADTVMRIRSADSRICVAYRGYNSTLLQFEDNWKIISVRSLSTGNEIDTATIVKWIQVHDKKSNE